MLLDFYQIKKILLINNYKVYFIKYNIKNLKLKKVYFEKN